MNNSTEWLAGYEVWVRTQTEYEQRCIDKTLSYCLSDPWVNPSIGVQMLLGINVFLPARDPGAVVSFPSNVHELYLLSERENNGHNIEDIRESGATLERLQTEPLPDFEHRKRSAFSDEWDAEEPTYWPIAPEIYEDLDKGEVRTDEKPLGCDPLDLHSSSHGSTVDSPLGRFQSFIAYKAHSALYDSLKEHHNSTLLLFSDPDNGQLESKPDRASGMPLYRLSDLAMWIRQCGDADTLSYIYQLQYDVVTALTVLAVNTHIDTDNIQNIGSIVNMQRTIGKTGRGPKPNRLADDIDYVLGPYQNTDEEKKAIEVMQLLSKLKDRPGHSIAEVDPGGKWVRWFKNACCQVNAELEVCPKCKKNKKDSLTRLTITALSDRLDKRKKQSKRAFDRQLQEQIQKREDQ